MRQCPECGMWFKNTKALNAHLRFCRVRNHYQRKEEIVTEEFTFKGFKFEIVGKKGFIDILAEVVKRAKEKGRDTFNCLIGAIYALRFAGIIQTYRFEPSEANPIPDKRQGR